MDTGLRSLNSSSDYGFFVRTLDVLQCTRVAAGGRECSIERLPPRKSAMTLI